MAELFGEFGMLEVAILVGALLLTAILVGIVFVVSDGRHRHEQRRLENTRNRAMGTGIIEESGEQASAVRRDKETGLDVLVKRFLPKPDQLRIRLRRTGRDISVGKFGVSILVIGMVVGLVCWGIFGFQVALSILIGVGIGIWLPHMSVGFMISRRQEKFTTRFPEGLDVIVRGLRAGLPIAESIVNARSEVPEPVRTIFSNISDSVNLGQNLEEAIADSAKILDTPELKFFAVSLSVQRETGGNLAETLSNLAEILRRRRQMKLKVKAMSSEARASAYIIGSLPFIMFGLIFFVNTSYAMELFTDPRGMIMVGVGGFMMALGVFIMIKMVNFEI